MKSIPRLAKVLRLLRKCNLAKPRRGRANGPPSETVPSPSRTGVAARTSAAAISCTLPRFCACSIFSRAQTRFFLIISYPSISFRTTEVSVPRKFLLKTSLIIHPDECLFYTRSPSQVPFERLFSGRVPLLKQTTENTWDLEYVLYSPLVLKRIYPYWTYLYAFPGG